jgi:alpha-L-fucosidase
MFERDLPGQNTAGYSGEAEIGDLPLETAETVNGSWGHKLTDHDTKSVAELVRYLVRAAGHDVTVLILAVGGALLLAERGRSRWI